LSWSMMLESFWKRICQPMHQSYYIKNQLLHRKINGPCFIFLLDNWMNEYVLDFSLWRFIIM
jgi:hypothetical protein